MFVPLQEVSRALCDISKKKKKLSLKLLGKNRKYIFQKLFHIYFLPEVIDGVDAVVLPRVCIFLPSSECV